MTSITLSSIFENHSLCCCIVKKIRYVYTLLVNFYKSVSVYHNLAYSVTSPGHSPNYVSEKQNLCKKEYNNKNKS